jgi:hypothetical protein
MMGLTATEMSMTPDRRRMRADVVAHQVLHALEPWIERLDQLERWHESERELKEGEERRRPPRPHREILRALIDVLYATGVEVITDADRAAAGLDHRHDKGMTDYELQIYEARRIEAMLRPMPPYIVPGLDKSPEKSDVRNTQSQITP